MPSTFNVTSVCLPDRHYMASLDNRLAKIKALVDDGMYFAINKARQYGKTTTLIALEQYLKNDYLVVSLDFQMFGSEEFENENTFALSFAGIFLRRIRAELNIK